MKKKSQLLRVIFLTVILLPNTSVFVCSSYTFLIRIYPGCLWIQLISYIQISPGYHSLPSSLGNSSVQTDKFLLTKLFSKFLSERFSLKKRNTFPLYSKGSDSMQFLFVNQIVNIVIQEHFNQPVYYQFGKEWETNIGRQFGEVCFSHTARFPLIRLF